MKASTLFWIIIALLGLGILAWWMTGSSRQPVLELQQLQSSCSPGGEDQVSLEPDVGEIRVLGSILTPTPCVTLEAQLQRISHKLTLVVTSKMRPGPCTACTGLVEYSGRITKLRSGKYTLEVIHKDRLVISQEVTVK